MGSSVNAPFLNIQEKLSRTSPMVKNQNLSQYDKGSMYFVDNSLIYRAFLRSTVKNFMVAKTIFDVRGPEKRKGDLSFTCLHEIKDKQL